MPRPLTIAVAQSGAVQKDDPRQANVARLCKMLSDAADQGADIVIFTEIALTTFFPRYYAENRADMDHWFEREMPNAETQPLFDLARAWCRVLSRLRRIDTRGSSFQHLDPRQ